MYLRIVEIGSFSSLGGYFLERPIRQGMHSGEQLVLGRIKRMGAQSALLLRLYLAELAKDPTSVAAASARSNLIALRHTIVLMFGIKGQNEQLRS